jgi:hypothetical protein
MPWQLIRIARFGVPKSWNWRKSRPFRRRPGRGPDQGARRRDCFTDTFIRRGPLPFTPGYDLVGVVETTGPGVTAPREGRLVADLCVVGGYAQYAIRPARFLVPVPKGVALRLVNLPELRVFLSPWKPGRFAGTDWWS